MKTEYKVFDGYVKYLDHMGSDEDIVDAARISYDRRGAQADRALIRYLMRHRHTSPFEMAEIKVEIKMPIFVARQWVRHRTASLNEVSARYTELPNETYLPGKYNLQSVDNKQGRMSEEWVEDLDDIVIHSQDEARIAYEELLKKGVAKEIARTVLPLSQYTKFVWKIDLHNLMHFLKLRMHEHAQQEIRDFAKPLKLMADELFPVSMEAWEDYSRHSYTLSHEETQIVSKILDIVGDKQAANIVSNSKLTPREVKEFSTRFGIPLKIEG